MEQSVFAGVSVRVLNAPNGHCVFIVFPKGIPSSEFILALAIADGVSLLVKVWAWNRCRDPIGGGL